MRNLRCVHQSQLKVDTPLPCTGASWDTSNDAVIFSTGPSKESAIIELRRIPAPAIYKGVHNSSSLIASWDAPCPQPDLEHDHVVSLQYLASIATTCLVLAGGDIVIVRDAVQPDQDKIEIVGSIDAGIATAAWSPDEDLLAITTRADTLIYMSSLDFEQTANAVFAPEDAKLSKQVNVGWGKKETQFQGKGAKALRDPTMPERVDEGTLSPGDDHSVSMSWRGDGAYIAVNTVQGDTRRMIRIFTRDGVLDSVSEAVDGLEGSVSWKPSGQLMAGVQRTDHDAQVVFFERNGLRHGEFSLRLGDHMRDQWTQRIRLVWNVDSSILAVCFRDRVQFWTIGNYHYYLKYETLLNGDCQNGQTIITWHPEDALRCFVRVSYGQASVIRSLRFSYGVSHGPTSPPHDLGLTAVIDGKSLRLTPLRHANVPPPMALHEVQLDYNALDVAISAKNDRLAVLHARSISVFEVSPKEGNFRPHFQKKITLTHDSNPLQIAFDDNTALRILDSNLLEGSVSISDAESSKILCQEACERAATLCYTQRSASLMLLADQCVFEDVSSAAPLPVTKFPVTVARLGAFKTASSTVVFGLSSSGSLYANDRLLMRNCTSFMLSDSHLLTTTTNHLLKFTLLENTDLGTLQIPSDSPDADELCRSVERGARLISVIPSMYAVVLQMPRGNLETIYPRALVLSGIRIAIDAQDYKRAFMACRNHRVDMNILHDHAPDRFLASVALIIEQLKKAEHIDLLLSQLTEDDVTQTLYRDPQKLNADRTVNLKTSGQSKVNLVCEAFLAVLESRYLTNLQNVITAHLCKSPPDIESGLKVILGLHTSNPDLVDDAVEQICFLADVNRIYEAALGIYNLDIALLIAQQSQKDPREYLPYLQSLQECSENRRRYQIDDDLGRHAKAVEHLYSEGNIDEVEKYATKHELHTKALQLCKYNKQHHDYLTRSYAQYLDSRNRCKEAAIAYESLQDYHSASTAYRAINMWREALSSAQLATDPAYTPEETNSLARALAEALEESKDYTAAAQIHLDYLSDLSTALRLQCKAHNFSDALRTAALHRQPALIAAVIDPGLGEGFGTLTELLAECKGQLNAQVPRIRELRAKRDADPLAFLEGGPSDTAAAGTDVPDDLSLAGSVTSTHASTLLTRYTARSGNSTLQSGASRKTSRNAKREERKRARGKKGSVYEEEYLVNSVGRLVERVNETGPEIERTVDALCRRGMWERAEALEAAAAEVVALVETCVPDVWEAAKKEGEVSAAADAAEDEYRPVGGDRVLMESMEATRKARAPPAVRKFTSSALLAK